MPKKPTDPKAVSGEIVPASSPAGISNLPFNREMEEYRTVLQEEAGLTKEREELDLEIEKFLQVINRENAAGYTWDVDDLNSAIRNARFAKVQQRPMFAEDIETLRKEGGCKVHELLENQKTRKILKKHLGAKSFKFLIEVNDAVVLIDSFKETIPDEERTKKVKTQLEEFKNKRLELEAKEVSIAKRKDTAKEYVSYIKDLASIAASTKRASKED